MAPDIFRVLIQSELSNLPVTCTQMIVVADFVSQPWIIVIYLLSVGDCQILKTMSLWSVVYLFIACDHDWLSPTPFLS